MIASIDLMDGKAVQLRRGQEKVLERDDPLSLAREFDKYGEVAVIDLDAAMGRGNNLATIREILRLAECRVGGGIRSLERAKELISLGAEKVIIGSRAFEKDEVNHPFLRELASTIGRDRIIIAVDALEGEIVTRGWKHRTGLRLFDVISEIEQYGSEFLFTCVEREGMLEGTDMETVRRLAGLTESKITVAGGVSSLEEIKELAALGLDVQLGMALYTGRISLSEAFVESLNWRDGLMPTVAQHVDGQVLMLAYSSRESLRKSFETGRMWYFSRSRNELWPKGETSGNVQELVRMRADCDRDALLATVRQRGVACHTGSYSCFGGRRFTLHELYEVLQDRLENPRPGSYTATLTDDLLKDKILEEARELVEAVDRREKVWELADMAYFLTVFLARNGIEIDDVLFELRRRRRG